MILMFEFPIRRTYELLLGQLQQARLANVNMKVSIPHIYTRFLRRLLNQCGMICSSLFSA